MEVDELLVRELKALSTVIAQAGGRVFHLEVFQSSPSSVRIPCIVYHLLDDAPEEELEDITEFCTAQYSVVVIANNSSELRAMANQIRSEFNKKSMIDRIFCEFNGKFNWLTCTGDSETNEFAFQQQEKGRRTSLLQVAIDYWR